MVALGAAVWAAREWKLFHPRPGEEVPAPVVEFARHMADFDVVIKGGMIVDGTGEADQAVVLT